MTCLSPQKPKNFFLRFVILSLITGLTGKGFCQPSYQMGDFNQTAVTYYNYEGIRDFHLLSDRIVFEAYGPQASGLWSSDGTSDGTRFLQDLGNFRNMTTFGNQLFFNASTDISGYQIWVSDGMTAGTWIFQPDSPWPLHPYSLAILQSQDKILFQFDDSLWVSDGTPEGSQRVYEGAVLEVTFFDHGIIFVNSDHELWFSDGTAVGTQQVFEGPCSKLFKKGGIVFLVHVHPTEGVQLWQTDGTSENTFLVKDLSNGSVSNSVSFVQNSPEYAYFTFSDVEAGTELWRTDGTEMGTFRLKDIYPGTGSSYPSGFTLMGQVLFFIARNPESGTEVWKSDGTPEGTLLLKDIYEGSGSSVSSSSSIQSLENQVFFSALTPETGTELWQSDGTEAGTHLVTDLYPGGSSSNPYSLTAFGDNLLFIGSSGSSQNGLYKTDGSEQGTVAVMQGLTSVTFPLYFGSVFLNGEQYFSLTNQTTGIELWKTDGTPDGTRMVWAPAPLLNKGASSYYRWSLNGDLFFSPDCGSECEEFWKVGVEPFGGSLLLNSMMTQHQDAGDQAFFLDNGRVLYKSDGSSEGTFGENVNVQSFTIQNDLIYFATYSNLYRRTFDSSQSTSLAVFGWGYPEQGIFQNQYPCVSSSNGVYLFLYMYYFYPTRINLYFYSSLGQLTYLGPIQENPSYGYSNFPTLDFNDHLLFVYEDAEVGFELGNRQ